MSQKSTAPVPRKIWRMSADAPSGEFVELGPAGEVAKTEPAPLDTGDWPVTDWQSSSYALLSGCQVKDYTERIPDRVFNALFKDE
jgi:hypothetical protein